MAANADRALQFLVVIDHREAWIYRIKMERAIPF
jgi:hypothetical protein